MFFVALKKNDSLFAKPGSSIVFHLVIHVIHGMAILVYGTNLLLFSLFRFSLSLSSFTLSLLYLI